MEEIKIYMRINGTILDIKMWQSGKCQQILRIHIFTTENTLLTFTEMGNTE